MEIKIKEYEQAPGNVSIGGIKWQKKWDVCIQCDSREEAESIKTQFNRDWDGDVYGYASRLAEAIYQKHYKEDSPEWKPLDTTLGVLTQIDNMTCCLVKAQSEPEPVAVEPTVAQLDQIINGLKRCFTRVSEREFLRVWVRDWTAHKGAPPQREWQGLTDEEANELTYASIAEIEAKLKEKNYG